MLKLIQKFLLSFVLLVCFCEPVFARSTIADIAQNMTKQMDSIAILLVVIAYVSGVGFSLMGITQFKANKDNPQQTPLSKPIMYIVIASALLFLPTLMKTAGESVFGGNSGKKHAGSMDFRAVDIE